MDKWFNTKPLFLIIFILGGPGIYNLWRQINGQGLKQDILIKKKNYMQSPVEQFKIKTLAQLSCLVMMFHL